jgi:flagellar biogenesis protein FliO
MRSLQYACLACALTAVFPAAALSQSGSAELYGKSRSMLRAEDMAHGAATNQADPHEGSFPLLKPPTDESRIDRDSPELGHRGKMIATPTITVASSLAVVLGLFAALVWGSRRFGGGAIQKGSLPKEIVQPLGSTAIDARTRLTMLRCGNRILVLAQSSGTTRTLCEITDPEEVRQLTAACAGTSGKDFSSALRSIERESISQGYVGSESEPRRATQRRRLFASV